MTMIVAERIITWVFALAVLVVSPAAPAWAQPEQTPTIELTPTAGMVGDYVVASGATCENHGPDGPGPPGGPEPPPAQVDVYWGEEQEVPIAQDTIPDSYTYEAGFVVPDVPAGTYTVWADCVETGADSPPVEFTVKDAEPEPVVVPELVRHLLDEVPRVLDGADLVVGKVEGSGDVVASQTPIAGTEVPPGTAVDVKVRPRAGPDPQSKLVRVPQLVGRPIDAAAKLLGEDLVLGQVSGTGDIIERQNPAGGAMVLRGSAVNISLTSIPPPDLVAVPDLLKKTLADARSIVPAARLVLANDPGGEGQIIGQSPSPGALVPPGSEIAIELATPGPDPPRGDSPTRRPVPDPSPDDSLIPRPASFVAGILVLLGAGWLLLRPYRKRGPNWVHQHVEIRLNRDQSSNRVELSHPRDGRIPTIAVRLDPHPDDGTVLVKEHPDE